MIGKKLDKYEIVQELGSGGMGAVYEARHVETKRRVAIKVILGELRADDALVLRFQREARAAGSIESRHIAQVLDAGKDPESGAPYLVMELLTGTDLDHLIKSGFAPFRPVLALRIVAQALAGLERAHAANVIHRDIKPANIYIAESDAGQRVVKLVDFGIAKMKDDVTTSREFELTQTASLLGSPLFMSPEQARTSKTVDGRADIWSLGTVLYQMLSGAAPHADKTSLTELLLGICTEPARPIQDTAPWVSPEIARIVARSLEIDVARRYASAAEMLEAIATVVPDWQQLDGAMFTKLTEAETAVVAQRVDPSWELGTSTGPSSQRPALEITPSSSRRLSVPEMLDATVVPASRQAAQEPSTEAFTTSAPGASATSSPGVGARTPTGADGLSSTNRGDNESPAARSRALPLAITVGVLSMVGVGLGVVTRGSSSVPPATPSVSSPVTREAVIIAAPVLSTASPASASPEVAPSASAPLPHPTVPSRPGPRPTTPPTPSATQPSTSASAKPVAPKPTTTSSSPISRDFN